VSSDKTPTLKPEVVTAKSPKVKSIQSGDNVDIIKRVGNSTTNAWNVVDQTTDKHEKKKTENEKKEEKKKKKKNKKKRNKTQPSPMLNSLPAQVESVKQPSKVEEKLKVDINEDSEVVDSVLAKSMLEKLGIENIPPPDDNIKTLPQDIWDPKFDLLQKQQQPEIQQQKSMFDDILNIPEEDNKQQNQYGIQPYSKVDVNLSPNVNDIPQNLPPILDFNSAFDNPFVFHRRTTSRFHFVQQQQQQDTRQQMLQNQFQQQPFTPPFMGQMNNIPFNPYMQQPPRQHQADEELQQSFRALLPNVKINFTSEHDQTDFQKPSHNQPNLGSSRHDSQNININNNINNININISNHNFSNSVHNFNFRNVTNNTHTNYNGYMGYPQQYHHHQQYSPNFAQNHQPFTQPMYSGTMYDVYKDVPPMHHTNQSSKFLHIIQQQQVKLLPV
jgi:hypothetical protein